MKAFNPFIRLGSAVFIHGLTYTFNSFIIFHHYLSTHNYSGFVFTFLCHSLAPSFGLGF